VELDPTVVETARHYFGFIPAADADPAVELFIENGNDQAIKFANLYLFMQKHGGVILFLYWFAAFFTWYALGIQFVQAQLATCNSEAESTTVATATGQLQRAIFIDVDAKDSSVGIMFPPQAFITTDFLETLYSWLRPDGSCPLDLSRQQPQYLDNLIYSDSQNVIQQTD